MRFQLCISLTCAIAFTICVPALSAEPTSDAEQVCRAHLEQLSKAIKEYRLMHDGKSPAHLSDLYYESYADDVGLYSCPAAGAARLSRTEIDAKGDYTVDPLAGQAVLVRERAPHHGTGVLAAMEDGAIKLLSPNGAAVAGATSRPAGNALAAGAATKPNGADMPRIAVNTSSTRPSIAFTGGDGFGLTGSSSTRPAGMALPETATGEDAARVKTSSLTIRGDLPPQLAMQIADKVYAEGGFDAAADMYQRVLASDPKSAPAMLGLARASLRTGQLHVARNQCESILAIKPDDPEARRIAATVDLLLGDTKKAVESADGLHREHPDDPAVAMLWAQAALYGGDDAEARDRFQAAAKANPGAARAERALADQLMNEKLLKLALLHYQSAAGLDESDDDALLGVGICAARLGQKDRAIGAFNEYLRRHPSDAESATAREELKKLQQK